MSETSRSRVTITLGRTGQVVVKRDGSSYDGAYANALPHTGNKRSVRERLGNSVDSSAQFSNKRMRGDGGTMIDAVDIRLSRDDLRHKIIRKNMGKQSHNRLQDGEDLRNILSRPAQSSINSVSAWEKLSETNDTRPRYLEPKDSRHHIPAPRDDRQLMPVSRNSSQHLPPLSKFQLLLNPRAQHVPDARESGRTGLEPKDRKYHMPENSRSSMISDVHGPRTANDVSKMEPGINSSSPWTLAHLRRRSPPDEALVSSRGLPALVRDEEPNRRYAIRTLGDTRSSALKDAFEFSRPTSSSSYLTKMAPPVGPMKTRAPIVSTHPLPSSYAQNTSYVVDDPTVDIFLRSLGLEKFAILFKAEEVDMYSLKRTSDSDLKELGIPMGPRKKIMLALQPRLRRQA